MIRPITASLEEICQDIYYWSKRPKQNPSVDCWNILMVHIHWASDARDPWSHAGLPSFPDNQHHGMHMYTVFLYHIVIVSDKNYHNMVKNYFTLMYTILLVTWETVKPCTRSRISCIRCSVYVHLKIQFKHEKRHSR